MIDILYFAWLRERIGLPRERVETGAATVRELVAELIDAVLAAPEDEAVLAATGARATTLAGRFPLPY